MQGKHVLITGGNSGIGLVAAAELAKQGATVVLAGRDSEKTVAALAQINTVASTPAINLAVDFANLQSVRDLATAYQSQYSQLDVLINNAGTFPAKQRLTDDGFEMQFGVNHLAHFLLTHQLLDLLKQSAPSRVVTVSSKLHAAGTLDFEALKGFAKYNPQVAYKQSKLANVLFSKELAQRLQGSGVTSNCLHPGAVATDIVRDMPWLVRKALGLMFIAPEKGAKTTVMLASDPSLAETTGQYYDQCELAEASDLANDKALRQRLWQVSAGAVGISMS
jgi:NAD(P)-dependent dehydrogenase (short-subunit alcohol dehydrogenase family)